MSTLCAWIRKLKQFIFSARMYSTRQKLTKSYNKAKQYLDDTNSGSLRLAVNSLLLKLLHGCNVNMFNFNSQYSTSKYTILGQNIQIVFNFSDGEKTKLDKFIKIYSLKTQTSLQILELWHYHHSYQPYADKTVNQLDSSPVDPKP